MRTTVPVAWLLAAGFLGLPMWAHAVPLVSLSWDGCTGPIDRTVQPGEQVSIYASVIGHDTPHKAYVVGFIMSQDSGGLIADAWQFYREGCQGDTRLTMDHTAPAEVAANCPSFHGSLPTVQVKTFGYSGGYLESRVIVAYANGGLGNTTEVDPTRRYFLARWKFDHSKSVAGAGNPSTTCGGLERGICIASTSLDASHAQWLDVAGNAIQFSLRDDYVTLNGYIHCPGYHPAPVPAINSTWGQIKGQYR